MAFRKFSLHSPQISSELPMPAAAGKTRPAVTPVSLPDHIRSGLFTMVKAMPSESWSGFVNVAR